MPNLHHVNSTASTFTLQFFILTPEINELIMNKTIEILERYNKIDYHEVIISALKELIYNASKANLKRVYFRDRGWDLHNMGHYAMGLPRFKEMIGTREMQEYFQRFPQQDLWTRFAIEHSSLGLRMEVSNHSAIIPIEEKRIRMKLALAMSREDILGFYYKLKDTSEGAGLGIALVINLLRSIGIDPSLFRIGSEENVTTARIEVPFTEEYIRFRKNHQYFRNIP